MTIEHIACDYLRPYIERWAAPYEVMMLPPIDYQGCHIEMSGEAMCVSCEAETCSFSLKKLWVKVEREIADRRHFYPASPRELAKRLIHTNVERHEDLKHLADSHQGMSWYGYSVGVGGYIHKDGKLKYISCWHIVVNEFEGDDVAFVFDLREIYHEIEVELKQGYAVVQPTLW